MSWVDSLVLSNWFTPTKAPIYFVYAGIVSMLVMAWVAAGYVTVYTVDWSILDLSSG